MTNSEKVNAPVTPKVRKAIRGMVEYLYDDEREHYGGGHPDDRKSHIFCHVAVAMAWLDGDPDLADEYLAEAIDDKGGAP
jgi:hypothetical protein